MRHLASRLAPALLLLGAAACASMPRAWKADEAQQAWVDAFVEAQQLASEGRIAGADSALARFVTRYPDSPEATETLYWRAILALDPANRAASPSDALRMLDGYLAAETPTTHMMEAQSLRRAARALDSLGRGYATARAAADSAGAAVAALKATPPVPDEVQKLKDELARTQAELERIRRRLSNPQGRAP